MSNWTKSILKAIAFVGSVLGVISVVLVVIAHYEEFGVAALCMIFIIVAFLAIMLKEDYDERDR